MSEICQNLKITSGAITNLVKTESEDIKKAIDTYASTYFESHVGATPSMIFKERLRNWFVDRQSKLKSETNRKYEKVRELWMKNIMELSCPDLEASYRQDKENYNEESN